MSTVSVKILADSISPSRARVTTFEWKYPRYIHAEVMTHRVLSRNAASSRAIPPRIFRTNILQDPARPSFWGRNQKGMQAFESLSPSEVQKAEEVWLKTLQDAAIGHQHLEALGVHKQLCNRVLEPWCPYTAIVTATHFENFFHLRKHRETQPEFQELAEKTYELYQTNKPNFLREGEWHLPLIYEEDRELIRTNEYQSKELPVKGYDVKEMLLCKVSVGRLARVSYLTHEGKRDLQADIDLHDRLIHAAVYDDDNEPIHASPFEHVVKALSTDTWEKLAAHMSADWVVHGKHPGNLWGVLPYRRLFEKESGPPMKKWLWHDPNSVEAKV